MHATRDKPLRIELTNADTRWNEESEQTPHDKIKKYMDTGGENMICAVNDNHSYHNIAGLHFVSDDNTRKNNRRNLRLVQSNGDAKSRNSASHLESPYTVGAMHGRQHLLL